MSLVIYLPQDAWNVKESLALLASTAATNTTATSQTSVTTSNSASARFVPGELTVRRVAGGGWSGGILLNIKFFPKSTDIIEY